MRLHRLDVTAFGPFAGTQTVDFDELSAAGLFLLHGATGAGKTSVLDAVCYALYGGVPGSRPGDRLRSDHADPGTMTEVVLDVTVGGRRLEITRRPQQERPKRRGTGTTVEKAVTLLRERTGDGEWRALSKSHQEVGEELLRLIGMSKEQFCQVVLLPQGEFAGFLRAGAAERAALLGRLFDTRRFKAVEEWLRERRRTAQERLAAGDQEIVNLAQRMRQAAGEGAQPLEEWLPDGVGPGHPDLAAHILDWAAVLRAEARERADIAGLALAAAERDHGAAQSAAEAERELHALQQRHAAARRRAEELAASRADRTTARTRLERAQRAAQVEPALDLRGAAAREHGAAAAAETTARAALAALPAADGRPGTVRREGDPAAGTPAGAEARGGSGDPGAGVAGVGSAADGARPAAGNRDLASGSVPSLDGAEAGGDGRSRVVSPGSGDPAAGTPAGAEARGGSGGPGAGGTQGVGSVAEGRTGATSPGADDPGSGSVRGAWGPAESADEAPGGRAATVRPGAGDPAAPGAMPPGPVPGKGGWVGESPHGPHAATPAAPHPADAGAEQLTAYEHRLRETLGGLAEAEDAERRAAGLAQERDRLDREAARHSHAVAEADAWLGGWDTVRRAHHRRIDDAQAAAARTGELAAERDRVRARLDAARRRDTHAAELARAEEALLAAREAAVQAAEAWQDVREARIAGMAAELAEKLTTGEPCLVCGAAEHPAPARPSGRQVTRDDEEAAHTRHQRADAARGAAQDEVTRLRAAHAAALDEAGEAPAAELAADHADREREHAGAVGAAADLEPAREALRRAEADHARRTEEREQTVTRVASLTSRRDELDRHHAELTERLARIKGPYATVAEHRAHLADRIERVAAAARAVLLEQETAERLKRADAALADAAYRAGFDTPEAAAAALLDDRGLRALRDRVEEWQREQAAVDADLTAYDLNKAAAAPPADPSRAQAAVDAATRRLREASAVHSAAEDRRAGLDRLGADAAARTAELAPARDEYALLRRLADLANGAAGSENRLRMELETYVLAARLEQVAAAAGIRLARMSSGRYTLVHTDARAARGARSGLGLMVVDAWTGTERDTATLSGGETFFASLALALGLADVVTDEAGGARLDTLFIDEGFGSLDDQTLDEVIDVLDELRERDRAVGIVSHVADLRHRVPAQLQVVKGQTGSTLRHRTAGQR